MTAYLPPPYDDESLIPERLAVVHATRYEPRINEKGEVEITPRSALLFQQPNLPPRNTTHFTLNHKVENHGMNSWSGAGIAIIAPFDRMCERNGAPAALNTVDTFWTSAPGKRLVLPGAHLVMPNTSQPGLKPWSHAELPLVMHEGNKTYYKIRDFTANDINVLREKGNIFFDRELAEVAHDPVRQQKFLAENANRHATNQTLERMGFEVQRGGMWGWSSGYEIDKKTSKLAERMNTSCASHGGSAYGSAEEYVQSLIYSFRVMEALGESSLPPVSSDYGHGYKFTNKAGKTIEVDMAPYQEMLRGEYMTKRISQIKEAVAKMDHNTQQVYANWFESIEPRMQKCFEIGKREMTRIKEAYTKSHGFEGLHL